MAEKRMVEKLIALIVADGEPVKLLKETPLTTLLELMTEAGVRFRGAAGNTVEDAMSFLVRMRDNLGINNSDLAKRTEVSRPTVSKILCGKAESLRLNTFKKIVNALSLNLELDVLDHPPEMTGFNEVLGGDPLTLNFDGEDLFGENVFDAALRDSLDPRTRKVADEWKKTARAIREQHQKLRAEVREQTRRHKADMAKARKLSEEIAELTRTAREREAELKRTANEAAAKESSFDAALRNLRETLAADRTRAEEEKEQLRQDAKRDKLTALAAGTLGLGGAFLCGDKLDDTWQIAAGVSGAGVAALANGDSQAEAAARYFAGGGSLGLTLLQLKKLLVSKDK